MIDILNACKQTGCTFLVGGRNVNGIFKVYPHAGRFMMNEKLAVIFHLSSIATGIIALYYHMISLQVLEDFDIPEELKDMFVSIPAEAFRMDISSTEIRKSLGL